MTKRQSNFSTPSSKVIHPLMQLQQLLQHKMIGTRRNWIFYLHVRCSFITEHKRSHNYIIISSWKQAVEQILYIKSGYTYAVNFKQLKIVIFIVLFSLCHVLVKYVDTVYHVSLLSIRIRLKCDSKTSALTTICTTTLHDTAIFYEKWFYI